MCVGDGGGAPCASRHFLQPGTQAPPTTVFPQAVTHAPTPGTTARGGFCHDSQASIHFQSSLRNSILCTGILGPVFR